MTGITLEQAAAWCGGTIDPKYKSVAFFGACIDSRKMQPGQLFVALIAARDGHSFVPGAMEKGAAAVLCSRPVGDIPSILVGDTRLALGKIAHGYLRQVAPKVVAVTGSVGKSTTKEMIAAVLGTRYRVFKTPANHNNDLGMPAAVLSMPSDTQVAVLEMGMNHFGEIDYLTKIGRPDIGVIINIGTMHIENLGSREGILQAKLELTHGMDENGTLLLYGDDACLWNSRSSLSIPAEFFATENPAASVRAGQIRSTPDAITFTVAWQGEPFEIRLNVQGVHHVPDALAAIHTGLKMGIPTQDIQNALYGFSNMAGRQEIRRHRGMTIICDCYNAGPESVAAALDVLAAYPGRKIAVLGDMLELGSYAEAAHAQIGRLTACKADALLCYGEQSRHTLLAAKNMGLQNAWHFDTHAALVQHLTDFAQPGDVLLFKGSRGMKMEIALEQFLLTK